MPALQGQGCKAILQILNRITDSPAPFEKISRVGVLDEEENADHARYENRNVGGARREKQ